ncbi:MAG: hypothetical protein KME46_34135 [Brasilonema angustatum HA4187-MV1]|jgi:hypothetical protein|nr:hypothetical protein [Brasilonema angustatum HA4187-MV1]
MLSIYQSEKVAIALKLIKEVGSEVDDTDLNKSILLGDAAEACEEVLKEDLPEGYSYTPLPEKKLQRVPTTGDRILKALSITCGTSIICAGLTACLSLGHWGASEFFNTNLRVESDLQSQSRSYLGLTAIFGSVATGSIVLAACVGRVNE